MGNLLADALNQFDGPRRERYPARRETAGRDIRVEPRRLRRPEEVGDVPKVQREAFEQRISKGLV